MSEALNQLQALDEQRYMREPIREYSRGLPNPFDLLTQEQDTMAGGRESTNVEDWRFMTSPEPGVDGRDILGMREQMRRRAEEMAEQRREMPFPPLEGRSKSHMVNSIDYGQGAPEISQHYQGQVDGTGMNQLLEDELPQLTPDELDYAPLTMDGRQAYEARNDATMQDKRRRMGYPPNPPKSPMP